MVGPGVGEQLGVDENVVDVDFKGCYSGEENNLLGLFIDVLIFAEVGVG